ncbi:MAG: hydantoinase/oxoprolinase family protein [Chloroflexi bacterium]|nr:hydantoinase/oxoprolinase family protein [Chloroflexota bacterium]
MADSSYRVGVDIGGTFTDLILVDDESGAFTVGKSLTTPADPSQAVEAVLRDALERGQVAPDRVGNVIHGTTLVTNSIIERKGSKTALLTTKGYRDAVEIGREHRYDLYDIFLEMPRPLVPRYLRLEVDERVLASGEVVQAPNLDDLEPLVREMADKGIQAVAVSFLHSYANPAHERQVGELIGRLVPNMRVSLSSDVVPEIREFERTSTTIANVYVQDRVDRYLRDLERRLRELGFSGQLFVMLSSGGIGTIATATQFPIRLLESGPAAGALATAYYGALTGANDLLSFDMGGTTAKLCVVEKGQPLTASDFEVDRIYRFKKGSGLPVKVPVIEMIEIGAGGGSIARIDAMGLLKVGPDSAGAEPGPVCYGRGGTQPTVTDADLILGYLDPAFFLGGRMQLDLDATERAIREHVAEPLGIDVPEAAWGIHQIVNESMANAARVHAVERGKDPRSFPLFTFGGAGPVHGFRVAEILHAPAMIAPFGAGITSTVGFLTAPLAFDFVRTAYGRLDELEWAGVNEIFEEMEASGRAILLDSGVPESEISYARSADVRYVGQGYEVRVPISGGELSADSRGTLVSSFEEVYKQLYGRTGPSVGLEVMSWRLVVSGPRPELRLRVDGAEGATGHAEDARKGERAVYHPEYGGYRPTPVYDRYRLGPGARFDGPAIVEERESTVVIGPRGRVTIDEFRNLRVELDG